MTDGEGEGRLREFLGGERLEDVALFLSDDVDGADRLREVGESVPGGVAIVVPGDAGRDAFASATGMDAMEFAREAMNRNGEVAPSLNGGVCPDGDDHAVRFVFAFAEAENEGVGGLYAEGDVVHAYAHCECGTNYSHKWVVGDRDGGSAR